MVQLSKIKRTEALNSDLAELVSNQCCILIDIVICRHCILPVGIIVTSTDVLTNMSFGAAYATSMLAHFVHHAGINLQLHQQETWS